MNKFLFAGIIGLSIMSVQVQAAGIAASGSNSSASTSSVSSANGGAGGQGGSASGYGGTGGTGGLAQSQGGLAQAGGGTLILEGGKDGKGGALATNIEFGDSKGSDLSESVPSVFSAGVTAGGSNPCVVSIGAGASGPGFGVNFARAYNDNECQIRESLRLMVAILPNNNDKGSQMLIREVACQSDVYWQSMERVYISTKDSRFLCTNPRPDNKPIAIRDRAIESVNHTASVAPIKTQTVVSNYNSHPFLDF